MARPSAIVNALKSIPGGARTTYAPQSSGMGRISPVQANAMFANPYADSYGPFLPRPSSVFTDGAFAPMSPIQPVPLDTPPPGGTFADPRWWQPQVGWNLPTQPGTEGLKLASFDQLRTLAQKYSVARAAIDLRQQEIRGLRWQIALTTDAAKAYQGDNGAMKDFGVRKAEAIKFFKRPDPDFWNFDSFLNAFLEEIFVYDALCVIFRPKYGASFGMGGRGLLGSNLDSLNLVSGPTIRPLVDMHGGHPRAPAPAYQQYLFGVPRSDYMTIATGADIDAAGLAGSEVNEFNADIMLYAPYWPVRESPYGFPPVERALLPIISGIQKQEFQLDYFTEGTVPAVYISPGDTNITPTQIGELQNALNALAGDPAYHLKVVVLPPGSKVEPQRPVDLSDSFDYLVMNQVCMAFDVQPEELGIIPNVGATPTGPSASGIRFAGAEARDIKSRKSTLPMLQWICDIFNYILQDICDQPDMQFQFEGLVDDEDKAAITELGVQQVQNAIASIDEVRERLDLPPWGLQETTEPVVFTAQGPVPLSMAPQLIMMAAQGGAGGGQGTNGGQHGAAKPKPAVRAGGATKPNGSHPAPIAPHREAPGVTPQHASAQGAIQSPTPRTGGTTSRSSTAGSRKKAAASELDALKRHIRKGKQITEWEPRHITDRVLGMIAEDIAKGVLLDTAIDRALDIGVMTPNTPEWAESPDWSALPEWGLWSPKAEAQFPGWQQDLGLVGRYKEEISQAFQDAEVKGSQLRKDAATGNMYVSYGTLRGLVSDVVRETFLETMTPMWEKAWTLGYESAGQLCGKGVIPLSGDNLQAFLDTEGTHWLDQISRTGLGNSNARSEIIARTEIARAMNAGAMQAYKDCGVQYKHLLIAPDDTCDICVAAKMEGPIPLDAIFPGGGLGGPFHPNCRCIPAPAGIEVEPPQAHMGKGDWGTSVHQYARSLYSGAGNCECGDAQDNHAPGSNIEDESRVAWLLIRARDEKGKWRYLLQQHTDGKWGMPGGSTHIGESGYTAAYRETVEEIGDLPQLTVVHDFSHMDPDGIQSFLYLCETKMFKPALNGSTPEETLSTAWFRKGEISDLDLIGKFRDDWEKEIHLKDNLPKSLQNVVNETGEWLTLDDPDRQGAGMGARWPYPHHANGEELGDAGPGGYPGMTPGGNPPHFDDNFADTTNPRLYEDGDEEDYPEMRGTPPSRLRRTPRGGLPEGPPDPGERPGISQEVANTGVPPTNAKNDSGHPVVGSVPAKTPVPYKPHSVPPEVVDPGEFVEQSGPEGNTVAKAAQDASDPNPVEWRHVYAQLESNFPDDAIEWVKRARWIGPVNIPWDRIDTDDEDKWAASHQPDAVNRFARGIASGKGNTAPSVLVQEPNTNKAFIVDGHHRAKARHYKLNKPVLAYVGNIDPKDRMAALETHTKQIHQGSDPGNK